MGKGDNYNIFFPYINKNNLNIIFEIGSRDGLDAIALYNYFKPKNIYIFEANNELIPVIKKNTSKYKFIIENYAIYSTDDEIKKFYICISNIGASSLLGTIEKDYFTNNISKIYSREKQMKSYELYQKYRIIETKTQRLDTYCKNNNIDSIDLICIDVEGVGLHVLQSLGKYIKNIKYIVCEYNKVYGRKNQDTYDEINEYLENNNFKLIKNIERDKFLGDGLWVNNM